MNEFKDVFSKGLGCLKTVKTKLYLQNDAVPVYCKPRVVPFALRPKVEAEIENLLKENVISPIEHSEWATPVVPVVKKNGTIRLCGDFKVSVNPFFLPNSYPMPTISDIQEKLNGGKCFSKIDLVPETE